MGMQQTYEGMYTPEGKEKWKNYEKAAAQQTLLRKDNEGAFPSQMELAWQKKVEKVEDGWQVVKGKKERQGVKESFEMILRSRSWGKGKT